MHPLRCLVFVVVVLCTAALPQSAGAAFPGQNGKIAFRSFRDGANAAIYVMNADGSAQTRITNGPGSDSDPAWSPDGRRIAFDVEAPDSVQLGIDRAVAVPGLGRPLCHEEPLQAQVRELKLSPARLAANCPAHFRHVPPPARIRPEQQEHLELAERVDPVDDEAAHSGGNLVQARYLPWKGLRAGAGLAAR